MSAWCFLFGQVRFQSPLLMENPGSRSGKTCFLSAPRTIYSPSAADSGSKRLLTLYTDTRQLCLVSSQHRISISMRDMSKTMKKKPLKITAASTRRSRSDTIKQIAAGTDLKPRQVKEVFDTLSQLMAADLGKKGCGEFNFNGLLKLRGVNKPATKARMGRNPFTGEQVMLKAKPASRKVRARALRPLNSMI